MFWIILGFTLVFGSLICGCIFSDPFWPGPVDIICPILFFVGFLIVTYGSGGFSFLQDYDWSTFFCPLS